MVVEEMAFEDSCVSSFPPPGRQQKKSADACNAPPPLPQAIICLDLGGMGAFCLPHRFHGPSVCPAPSHLPGSFVSMILFISMTKLTLPAPHIQRGCAGGGGLTLRPRYGNVALTIQRKPSDRTYDARFQLFRTCFRP